MDVCSIACWSPQYTHYVQGQAKGLSYYQIIPKAIQYVIL